MPTLAQYANDLVQRLDKNTSDALAEFGKAQADRTALVDAHEEALARVGKADRDLADVRRSLGGSEVPAHAGTTGAAALRKALLEQRSARAGLLAADAALHAGEDQLARTAAAHASFADRLRAARQLQIEMSDRSDRLVNLAAAVAAGTALGDLPGQITTQFASEVTRAQGLVEKGLPDQLRNRAIARLDAVLDEDDAIADHLVSLEDQLDGIEKTDAGTPGQLAAAARTLDRAEAALAEFVAYADAWTAEIATRLARVERRALTSDELAGLTATSVRIAAATAEDKRDQAALDVASLQRQRELAVVALLSADADADITADSGIIKLDQDIAAAAAKVTITATDAENIASWQTEVPESAWEDLLDFQLAKRRLAKLAAIVPADLSSAATAAEIALAAALQANDDFERRREAVRVFVDGSRSALARIQPTTDERRRAALRGWR